MNSDTAAFLRDTTVFTIATTAWVSFVLNLRASFEACGIDPRGLVVYALDDDTERILQHAGVPPAQIKRHDVGQVDNWVDFDLYTGKFSRVVSAKFGIAASLLMSGGSVLFVDGDIVVRRDPTAYLSTVTSTSRADLIMQFESPKNEYNTGFWYANGSPDVIDLFTQMEQSLLVSKSLHDQHLFNIIVANPSKLRIYPLDVRLFACGNQFYDTPEVAEDAYILHFNYLADPERRTKKLLAMERVGAVMHPLLASEVRRAKRRIRTRAAVRRVTPRLVRRAVRRILPRASEHAQLDGRR